MLIKNKSGMWDLTVEGCGQGEGIYNITRTELEGLKAEIEAELINEDIKGE